MNPDYSADYLERCRTLADAALSEIPVYEKWARYDVGGPDILTRLAALPFVDKALMRTMGPECFVNSHYDLPAALASGEVELVHTSGSTGDQVSNVWCQTWWNASEQASWQLNSHARRVCDGTHPEAILASPLCVGFSCEKGYLPRPKRTLGRFLFLNERMNPCEWTPAHMRRMTGEINDFRPVILEASPSYLAHLCRFAANENLNLHSPELIVLTFENPSLLHRRQIRAVFRSPIASSYGSTETGYVFMECECGRLHQNTEYCHVDFIPFAPRHGGPEIGAILVTTFHNPWRVLLRFDIGDIVRLATDPCPCGRRAGLTLTSIEGRGVNMLLTPDGRAVTQNAVDRCLGNVPGLVEYQLVQSAQRDYRLTYVCPEEDAEGLAVLLHPALCSLFGDEARIRLERAGAIAPDPPGKFRLCKPLIPMQSPRFWAPRCAPPVTPIDPDKEDGSPPCPATP
ncbi:MAG: hypothetical protein R6X19_02120 [Kiritimatiellia bacterium]